MWRILVVLVVLFGGCAPAPTPQQTASQVRVEKAFNECATKAGIRGAVIDSISMNPDGTSVTRWHVDGGGSVSIPASDAMRTCMQAKRVWR